MKILPVDKIREADAYTIREEPIADIDLMERAATACYYWLIRNIPHDRRVLVFCGTGNNGGDGLAIARMMSAKGYRAEVFIAGPEKKFSPSCRT
ncbi:MAG TPA: NAD(P)H-hydrate epimerase, partial [Bacteroidales bacterium]|nr:NAD(P)H-hydrate epimerase [Bacteroidales bacterium]